MARRSSCAFSGNSEGAGGLAEAQGGRRGREAWAKTEADNVLSERQTSTLTHLLRSSQFSSPTLRISAHNSSSKTLCPAGSCCLRLRKCTQPFQRTSSYRRASNTTTGLESTQTCRSSSPTIPAVIPHYYMQTLCP